MAQHRDKLRQFCRIMFQNPTISSFLYSRTYDAISLYEEAHHLRFQRLQELPEMPFG